MPTFNVIIQPEAQLDLDDAYNYLESVQEGLGFDLLEEIVKILEILEQTPRIFQFVHGEKRKSSIHRFSYHIIYKIKSNEVYILAIMHDRRDPKKWKQRK